MTGFLPFPEPASGPAGRASGPVRARASGEPATRGPRCVDLFAGAGGFTLGAELAGARVLAAANHWPPALSTHEANHAAVSHLGGNLLEMDPGLLPAHDLLLASPACQGDSTASQPKRRPKHEADRNTMWAVVSMAEGHRPDTILVENVASKLRWALFPVWCDALRALGYHVRSEVFDVADWGVPQNRKRLIITARQGEELRIRNPRRPHEAIGPHLDFERGSWAPVHTKPDGPRRYVARGRARGLGERFLVHYSSDHHGRELSRPIATITTKNQWALVRGDELRMLDLHELRAAMSFPADYWLPPQKNLGVKLLGNAIPPLFAQDLVRQAS